MTELHFAAMRFLARPDRTLFHPDSGRLFISDLHLGKGAMFRRAGIPIPAQSEEQDLIRLQRAIKASRATSLWVLGDLFHAPSTLSAERLMHWRECFDQSSIERVVILGNHDRQGEAPAVALGFSIADEPTSWLACDLAHHPDPAHPRPRIAGHVHPQALLQSATDRLIYPCFAILDSHTLLLPAFTEFSGGPRFRPSDAELFIITPLGVLPPSKPSPPLTKRRPS